MNGGILSMNKEIKEIHNKIKAIQIKKDYKKYANTLLDKCK